MTLSVITHSIAMCLLSTHSKTDQTNTCPVKISYITGVLLNCVSLEAEASVSLALIAVIHNADSEVI